MPVEVADLREDWWRSITADQLPELGHLDLLNYRAFIQSETRRVGVQLSNYKRGAGRETFDDNWRKRAWFAHQRLLQLRKAVAAEMRIRHRKKGFQRVMTQWNIENNPGAITVSPYQENQDGT